MMADYDDAIKKKVGKCANSSKSECWKKTGGENGWGDQVATFSDKNSRMDCEKI